MKITTKTLALLSIAFLLASGAVFGQGLLPKKIWVLTVLVDAPGAAIYVDNVLVQGNATNVAGGAHNVKVLANGYYDFIGPVTVTGNQTFRVQLRPRVFPVTVRVNVPNAVVLIDGVQVAGVPSVSGGNHTIQVSANGYADYSTSVNVSAPMALDVVLNPLGYLLTVNSNVQGATVAVNNLQKGVVPYSEYLPSGTYSLRISATGYVDYMASVALDRPIVVNVQLQQAAPPPVIPATVSFSLPSAFLDQDMKPNDPQGLVKIFIDGRRVNPRNEMDKIPVSPGRHRIRIASGAFSVQLGDIDIQAGTSYVFELSMELRVRATKAGSF